MPELISRLVSWEAKEVILNEDARQLACSEVVRNRATQEGKITHPEIRGAIAAGLPTSARLA